MSRGSREGTIDRGFRSWLAGLVFASVGIVMTAQLAAPALAAGDGKSAALSNELRALSATSTLAVPEPAATTAVKKAKPKVVAKKKPGKKTAATNAAGAKVKLTAKMKSQKAEAKVSKKRKGGTKVASASAFVSSAPIKKSLSKKGESFKGNVSWNASSGCLPGSLKSVVYQVSNKFGPVVVNSTARGHRHNRRVGGARKSWHLRCMAIDFRVHGSSKGLWAYLRSHPAVGGLHRYPSGFFHIDAGPKRTW